MITALDWAASWLGGIIAGVESEMITYKEVKDSPSGWEDITMSFESDLAALVEAQRNLMNKAYVSKVLVNASEQVEKDESWIYDETSQQPEPPVLTSIDPATAVIGDADQTLTATGSAFTEDSVIVFNGGEEATEFVSETELTTIVKPSLAGAAITVPVLVRTAGQDSDPLDFTFTEAAGE